MLTYKVYQITNKVNGKVYVGITQQQYLSHRFWEHANRKQSCGAYLYWSINKHGKNNFTMDLLHEYTTPDLAKSKEKELIALWQLNRYKYPNGNGMNLTDGGDGSYGCKHKPSSIKKMSGKNNHNYGLLGAANPSSKAVEQYSLNGKYLQTHGGFYEAARNLKPGCARVVQSSIASNIRTSIFRGSYAYGYRWKYV